MKKILLFAIVWLFSLGVNAQGFQLNSKGYFQNQGVSVMVFDDVYPEGHQSGVCLIMNGNRIATNGDLRLEATPGQWQPLPKQLKRTVAGNSITTSLVYPDSSKHETGFNPIIYPDLHLSYSVKVEADGDDIIVTLDLDQPVPEEFLGKVGFNFEFFPGSLFGKPWIMDQKSGIYPQQPNAPLEFAKSNMEHIGDFHRAGRSRVDLEHLLGKDGKRFMVPIHELAELAPRDIVARSIFKQMIADGMPYVTLSLKHLDPEMIVKRFPGIYAQCKEFGYDLTQEIPVAPAAHYSVGGVLSNSNGRTDVERLYVCGEVAATGIMGANRLASNSLIECLVFANRAVEDTVKVGDVKEFPSFDKQYSRDENNAQLYAELKSQVAEIMNYHAGIIRSEESLTEGLQKIEQLRNVIKQKQDERGGEENREYYLEASRRMLCVARLIMSPALLRKESRGGHYREDFPCADEAFALHSVQRRGEQITTAPVNSNYFNF